MKRIVFTFGLVSGAIVAVVLFGSMAIWGTDGMTAGSVWLGYSIMVIALSVIFFAVKSYRDDQLGGVIRFWTALRLGLGITAVAGAVYVIGWEIYYQTLGGNFMDHYIAASLERLRNDGAAAAELARARQDMEEFRALYENLAARMVITLLEILPVGVVIALFSAALLRKT